MLLKGHMSVIENKPIRSDSSDSSSARLLLRNALKNGLKNNHATISHNSALKLPVSLDFEATHSFFVTNTSFNIRKKTKLIKTLKFTKQSGLY